MPRKLLRALLAIAIFTIAWLVASPASAAQSPAPLCDPRGAITFAPPPQIQDAELSLDIPADCVDVSPLESKNIIPGRGLKIDVDAGQDPACARGPQPIVLAPSERLAITPPAACPARPGVGPSVDRPPQR